MAFFVSAGWLASQAVGAAPGGPPSIEETDFEVHAAPTEVVSTSQAATLPSCSTQACFGAVHHMIVWARGDVSVILEDITDHVGSLTECVPENGNRFVLPVGQTAFDAQYSALLAALHTGRRVGLRVVDDGAGACDILYIWAYGTD